MSETKTSPPKGNITHNLPSKRSIMRKYDLLDMFTISLYNAAIFAGGLSLGWFIWNQQ